MKVMHKTKLVVVGVGHVGSYVLADAMKVGLFAKIVLIDVEGVLRPLSVALNDWETQKLQESIAFIQATMRDAGTGPKH